MATTIMLTAFAWKLKSKFYFSHRSHFHSQFLHRPCKHTSWTVSETLLLIILLSPPSTFRDASGREWEREKPRGKAEGGDWIREPFSSEERKSRSLALIVRGFIVVRVEAQWPRGYCASSSPDRAVLVRSLAGDIVLCSGARHLTFTVPLSTQVYKWVPANLMLGVTLRWTRIPSRGKKKYS